MNASPTELQRMLQAGVEEYCYSAFQFVGQAPGASTSLAGGMTSWWGQALPVSPSTLFDIGSVTKAVATVGMVARWVQGGGSLDRTPSQWLPGLSAPWKDVPLRQFLDHSSGLRAWLPLYESWERGDGLADWLARTEGSLSQNPPGTTACYSDLNFWVLGAVLQAEFGLSLKEVYAEEVAGPLGLSATYGPVERAVATEYHIGRGGLLEGQVFDDNCAAMGGVGPHAGLFSHGEDLARWGRHWLDALAGKSSWLQPEVARRFITPTGAVKGSTWALGWDTKSPQGSTCGQYFSKETFGHLGYPGASVWMDPTRDWVAVLLTNRVHPSRVDERIRKVRPRVHDLWASDHLERKSDG